MSKSGNMKWVKTAATAAYENYTLVEGEKELVHLHYNNRNATARVETAREKRVFMIDRTGFLKNKVVLLNEYGYEVGRLGFENAFSSEGFIKIEGEKFFYRMQNNPLAELIIYKHNRLEPLVSCGIKTDGSQPSPAVVFTSNASLEDAKSSALLLSLCWFLFLPVAKETQDYALWMTS